MKTAKIVKTSYLGAISVTAVRTEGSFQW